MQTMRLASAAELRPVTRNDLFDGVVTIVAEGRSVETDDWDDALYRTRAPREAAAVLTAIPYYLWSNREKGSMTVWISEA